MSKPRKIFAQATLTHPATQYVELFLSEDTPLSAAMLRWFDGTSSATVTLETSLLPKEGPDAAASDSTTAEDWAPEAGVTITGPVASAAGSEMIHLGNLGARRARLKIVTVATTDIEVWGHAKSDR